MVLVGVHALAAFDRDVSSHIRAGQYGNLGRAHSPHAWDRTQSLSQLIDERDRFGRVIPAQLRGNRERNQILRVQP